MSLTKLSYSQYGEDLLFEALLLFLYKRKHPFTYFDIGSNNPVIDSNTYLAYSKGGQGVLVEPNPMYKDMTLLERPRDIFYSAGISFDGSDKAVYYDFGTHSGLNTFSENIGENVEKIWQHAKVQLKRKIELPMLHVNDLLRKHFTAGNLDILSVDCEGVDMQILDRFDFSIVRPRLICIEHDRNENGDAMSILGCHDYVMASTNFVNKIYIDGRAIKNNSFIPIQYAANLYDINLENTNRVVYNGLDLLKILGGISVPEPFGIWSSHEKSAWLEIMPDFPIPPNFSLEINCRVVCNQGVRFEIGAFSSRIFMTTQFQKYRFNILNYVPELPIKLFPTIIATPKELGINKDTRRLGIAIKNIDFIF